MGSPTVAGAVPEPPLLGLLRRESGSLVQRLRLWTPARYAAAAAPWGTRGDLVHHLAQSYADLAARVEGGAAGADPRPQTRPLSHPLSHPLTHPLARPLPRLDTDLALADQLAVTADDLVRATAPDGAALPDELARAAVAHLLAHRADLLGEPVPASLEEALGTDDVVAAGRRACGVTPPAVDPRA